MPLLSQVPVRTTSHISSVSKHPLRSIVEEETERIENAKAEEEAKETDYCIKGYDFNVSVIC